MPTLTTSSSHVLVSLSGSPKYRAEVEYNIITTRLNISAPQGRRQTVCHLLYSAPSWSSWVNAPRKTTATSLVLLKCLFVQSILYSDYIHIQLSEMLNTDKWSCSIILKAMLVTTPLRSLNLNHSHSFFCLVLMLFFLPSVLTRVQHFNPAMAVFKALYK